jgi:DNA-binding transcriptional LysR family regulator
MDLDAKPYRCFLTVAETGSFGRAATIMNMSQPALSALIKEFERRLGFDLFTRTSRRVELTAQGQLFLGNARRIVTETAFARRMAADISANQLLIGATYYTAIIAERIALTDGHLRENPDVPTRISVRTQRAIYDDLQQNRLELAIVLEHEATPSQQSMFAGEIPSEGACRACVDPARKALRRKNRDPQSFARRLAIRSGDTKIHPGAGRSGPTTRRQCLGSGEIRRADAPVRGNARLVRRSARTRQ